MNSRHFRIYVSLLVLSIFMAACGPTSEPTATPMPTETPALTEMPTVIPSQNLPGTLIPPRESGQSIPENAEFDFESVIFVREGGIAGETLEIMVRVDGLLMRNGTTLQISNEDVARLNNALNQIAFYDLGGQFTAPNVSPDAYIYNLEVTSERGIRQLTAQDGMTPPELLLLFDSIAALGAEAVEPPTPGPTETPMT